MRTPLLPWKDWPPSILVPGARLTDHVKIASTPAEFRHNPRAYDGWRTATRRIYMRCPFHRERSPSLVVYPKEPAMEFAGEILRWIGRHHYQCVQPTLRPSETQVRLPHFHCYGCGMSGTKTKLIRKFRWGGGYAVYKNDHQFRQLYEDLLRRLSPEIDLRVSTDVPF